MVQLIAHGKVDGPCLTHSIRVHGRGADVEQYKQKLRSAGPPLEEVSKQHRLSVRGDFHLKSSRLLQSDLDNLSKALLDGLFGTFGKPGSQPRDNFVWHLDVRKVEAAREEFTEFWIFDEGPIHQNGLE